MTSSRDSSLSLPMEIITRYDFHRDFYSVTSRNRSTEVINTSRLGVCNSLDIIVPSFPSIADDVMIEILSRLPVKSLMRFKSVSKHWMSLIKQDEHLIKLHFNHSKSRPNLLYMNPLQQKGLFTTTFDASCDASKTLRQSISCAEMMGDGGGGVVDVEAIVSKVRITDDKWFPYKEVLGPVNGLVCFVHRKTYAVRVYNVSTREITPWVKSTLLVEENDKLKSEDNTVGIKTIFSPIYHFGFDPENKEYKVFCYWRLAARPQHYRSRYLERHDYARWEVLTVGRDTKWRKINMVPNENNKIIINEVLSPYDIGRHPVYADGTLYWCNKVYSCGPSWGDPDVIVALDVGSEKFRVISIPNFILDEPREKRFRLPNNMFILGGRVTLLYRMESFVVKLWMLDDGADNKLENCQGNQSNWSEETIQLPFYCDSRIRGSGVAGSNETIVFEWHHYKMDADAGYSADFVSLYSYDRRKKSIKKIEMDGNSVFPLRSSRSLIGGFTESLYSF